MTGQLERAITPADLAVIDAREEDRRRIRRQARHRAATPKES